MNNYFKWYSVISNLFSLYSIQLISVNSPSNFRIPAISLEHQFPSLLRNLLPNPTGFFPLLPEQEFEILFGEPWAVMGEDAEGCGGGGY